jgi:predicted AAA+ superfamily ATPase
MEDLLYQYNPWWEGQIDLSGIRPRKEQLDKISSLVSEKRVVFLTGLRRVGKTTLMHLFVDQLVRDGLQPVKIFYVSLDDYLLRNDAIVDIVATYRKIHKLGVDRSVTLLLDEITYKENYQQQLKSIARM